MLSPLLATAAVALCGAPALKVTIVSTPPGAEVSLDGVPAGVTPLELLWPGPGRHVVVVSAPRWSSERRVVTKVEPGEQLAFALVDLELQAAQKRLAAAQTRYDRENGKLARLQAQQAEHSTDALEGQRATAEVAMQRAAEAFERAEKDLVSLEMSRKSEGVERTATAAPEKIAPRQAGDRCSDAIRKVQELKIEIEKTLNRVDQTVAGRADANLAVRAVSGLREQLNVAEINEFTLRKDGICP